MSRPRGAILALALASTGCSGAAPTPSAFLTRANQVCASSGHRIQRLAMPRGAHAQEGYVAAYVSELRDELQRLQRLGYPRGERQRLQAIYRQIDRRLAAMQAKPQSFRRAQLSQANRALWREGLTACRI